MNPYPHLTDEELDMFIVGVQMGERLDFNHLLSLLYELRELRTVIAEKWYASAINIVEPYRGEEHE